MQSSRLIFIMATNPLHPYIDIVTPSVFRTKNSEFKYSNEPLRVQTRLSIGKLD